MKETKVDILLSASYVWYLSRGLLFFGFNTVLELYFRLVKSGAVLGSENDARTSETAPEIWANLSDTGSGIQSVSATLLGQSGTVDATVSFENGLLRMVPKAKLSPGRYELVIKASDGANPPNTQSVTWVFVVEQPFQLYWIVVPTLAIVAVLGYLMVKHKG